MSRSRSVLGTSRHDALGDTLHDGGLAHARLADEHGVVLGAAAEHLDGATDFLGTANDRVELACARQIADVTAVLLQRLELHLVIFAGHAIVAAQLRVDLLDAGARHTGLRQNLPRLALVLGQRHKQVFGHHKVVLHLGGELLGLVQNARQLVGKPDLSLAAHLGRAVNSLLRRASKLLGIGADALDNDRDVALAAGQQRAQQVDGLHRAGVRVARDTNCRLQRFLGGHRQLVDPHIHHLSRVAHASAPGLRPLAPLRASHPTGRLIV